jgi:hypothetical protein
MDTLQILLNDGLKVFLEERAIKNGFATAGDYVQSLLADLRAREEARKALEAKLLEGVRSPKVVADEKFWQERRQKIYDKHPELAPCKQNTQESQ